MKMKIHLNWIVNELERTMVAKNYKINFKNKHELLVRNALNDNEYLEYLLEKLGGQMNEPKNVILYGSEAGNENY